jgi:hypothetical protein
MMNVLGSGLRLHRIAVSQVLLSALLFSGSFSSVDLPAHAASEKVESHADDAHAVASKRQYIQWQQLPPGKTRQAFDAYGSKLINNLNLVALENGKPTLIRGGGFTKAGLNWLVNDMGVRTIIDLRGRFADDKTNQIIVHSPELLAKHKKAGTLDQLENLSPAEVKAYVAELSRQKKVPIQYYNIKAEDPATMTYLSASSPENPVAMFCQYGVNRSGTAWGAFVAQQGWPIEQAYQHFGIRNDQGEIRNKRDILYGYNVHRYRSKQAPLK